MKPASFLTLAAVTVVAAVAAVWITLARDTGPAIRGEGRVMFPDLAERANDVRRIVVTRGTGTTTVTASRAEGELRWKLEELHGYPVPIEVVRAVVGGMARVAAIEPKTTMPEKYPRIRVEMPEGKESKSARVQLFAGDGAELADLIVGLAKESLTGPGQVYVRRPGEARSWLARGSIPLPEKRIDWVDRIIVGVDLPRVREATVFVPGEPPLRVFKKGRKDRDFTVAGAPEGYELKEIFAAEDIARMIQDLTMEAVRPSAEIGFDLAARPRARHVTFDGLIVETWLKKQGGRKWIAVRARANPDPAPVDEVDPEKVAAEVEKINGTTTGWAYTISDFQTGQLMKTMADIIEAPAGRDE